MNISSLTKTVGRTLADNSPAILAGVAVTGTVSTAFLAAKGTVETTRDYDNLMHYEANAVEMTKVDMVRRYWKNYIPAAATGLVTVGCIVGGTTVSHKRQAVLVSAYSLSERAFSEFREKAVDSLGPKKTQEVYDNVARERMVSDPASKSEIVVMASGKQLCYESYSGRYFESDIETIRKAQNDMNTRILNEMYVSLNDFFDAIGLTTNSAGEELGFSIDNQIDVQFSAMLTDDQRPCICIGYSQTPIRDFYKLN